jgi:hypothetical protein
MAVAPEPEEEEGGIIWLDDDEVRAEDDGEHWQVMELSMLTSFGR